MSILLVVAMMMLSVNLAIRALTGHMEPIWVAVEVVGILFCGGVLILTRNER